MGPDSNADPMRWRHVEQVLDELLEHQPSEWPAILDRTCGDDAQMRSTLEDLLRRRATLGSFLTGSVADAILALGDASAQTEGERIGPYRLIREIGHGGMSRVFLAERADGEFVQRVALKLLRDRFRSPDLESRLRAERQILANLNHPHIARLLDGGVTADGLPYLVMEYVEGEAIDQFCDNRRFTNRERLQLFLAVTDAVRYAHRNLIVHRDLKPSNIMVTADGAVKLLDFGIAKLLAAAPSTEPETRTGKHWITPEYAAPEQIRGEAVTTASDVYQLGAVLHQLLSGQQPGPLDDLRSSERPSTALRQQLHSGSESAAAIVQAAAARKTDPAALCRMLQGDLDAILSKALRHEPDQRYLSAEALRADIEGFLAGRPVWARHVTTAYRIKKFVKRNPWPVAAAATVAFLLVGYVVTINVHSGQTRRALAAAEHERAKSEGDRQFLIELFGSRNPGVRISDNMTVAQLLEHGEQQADDLAEQPLVQAELRSVLGAVRMGMFDFPRAQAQLDRALALRRSALGEEHSDVAESLTQLGILARTRGGYDDARAYFERALAIQRRAVGDDHYTVAQSYYLLARLANRPIDESITLARQALVVRRRALGSDHSLVAEDMLFLGNLLRRKGDLAEAEAMHRAALDVWTRAHGPDHPDVTRAMAQLATTATQRGELDVAEDLFRAVLEKREKVLGPHHDAIAAGLLPLASVLLQKGELVEAESLLRRAITIREGIVGAQHPRYSGALAALATVLQAGGNLQEAESLRRRELSILRAAYGEKHTAVAGSLHNLGEVLQAKGEYAEAETMMLQAKSIRDDIFGADSDESTLVLLPLGDLARARGNLVAAESLYTRALARLRSNGYGDKSGGVQEVHRRLATLYGELGKPDKAAAHRAALLAGAR